MTMNVTSLTAKDHLNFIVGIGSRHTVETARAGALRLVEYVASLGLTAVTESFLGYDGEYLNLIIGNVDTADTVITAHYDTTRYGGACDNGSGVATALRIAELTKDKPVSVVLTACEEPPHFGYVMGAQVLSHKHGNLARARWYALDSLGWKTGMARDDKRELLLHAPSSVDWIQTAGTYLEAMLPTSVTYNNSVRMLSEVRQADADGVLVLDTNTLSIPFHTKEDTIDRVDCDWLEEVAKSIAEESTC